MTATATELPRFSDSDLYTARFEALRNVAELENREAITPDEANRRVERLTRHRDLTPEAREQAYEQLREAELRLAHIRGDMFDPCDGDRDSLELDADHDAINAVRKLIGHRP